MRHFREAIEPVRDRAGKIIGLIGAATDITEQRDTQQQLRESLTFREQMMGILGHDLRNPLSTIIMTDGLLLKQEDVAPDAHNLVLRSLRAAERMGDYWSAFLRCRRTFAIFQPWWLEIRHNQPLGAIASTLRRRTAKRLRESELKNKSIASLLRWHRRCSQKSRRDATR
jgi:signal transduction histidine kinase